MNNTKRINSTDGQEQDQNDSKGFVCESSKIADVLQVITCRVSGTGQFFFVAGHLKMSAKLITFIS